MRYLATFVLRIFRQERDVEAILKPTEQSKRVQFESDRILSVLGSMSTKTDPNLNNYPKLPILVNRIWSDLRVSIGKDWKANRLFINLHNPMSVYLKNQLSLRI
jgi:hypothetical protein